MFISNNDVIKFASSKSPTCSVCTMLFNLFYRMSSPNMSFWDTHIKAKTRPLSSKAYNFLKETALVPLYLFHNVLLITALFWLSLDCKHALWVYYFQLFSPLIFLKHLNLFCSSLSLRTFMVAQLVVKGVFKVLGVFSVDSVISSIVVTTVIWKFHFHLSTFKPYFSRACPQDIECALVISNTKDHYNKTPVTSQWGHCETYCSSNF